MTDVQRYDPDSHHRRSISLRGYDYTQPGAYFITVCTHKRAGLFGRVADGDMTLNDAGRVAVKCWKGIPAYFPHVDVDEFVVMPNHIHGILSIVDAVGAKHFSPLKPQQPHGTSKTLGSIIRGFKIGVTKWIRHNTEIHNVWQRNYWERIVRNEKQLNHLREYIVNNPAQWESDQLYPCRGEKSFAPTTPGRNIFHPGDLKR
jgi:REP element-mobilizing transposase RayT